MRINHNISAVITNKQLLRTEDTLAASMERLSSGLSINHAKDNPSGMAISGKMKAQIDGLNMSSRNSSDGISVIETADGALNEVSDIIQRIRELSVQAANDTNAQTEREHIQTEIDSLKSEIDRISSATEFNTKKLLDGSLDARVYSDKSGVQPERIQVSEGVPEGTYKFKIDSAATRAEGDLTIPTGSFPVGGTLSNDMSFTINSVPVYLKAGMSEDDVYGEILEAAEIADVEIEDKAQFLTDHKLTIKSKEYGADAKLHVVTGQSGATFTGDATTLGPDGETYLGKDAKITLTRNSTDTVEPKSQFDEQAYYKMKGNKLTIQSSQGFEMTMKLPVDETTGDGLTGDVSLNVTDIGPMTLQIGANEGQQMRVRVPSTDLDHLYLDDLKVTTKGGPDKAMAQCDEAINRLSEIRAKLGAYENRLEHTVASLDTTEENMTAAISRIGDVDMATEMVEYTKDNVLAQAGTSALSQANELPQMALQLLG